MYACLRNLSRQLPRPHAAACFHFDFLQATERLAQKSCSQNAFYLDDEMSGWEFYGNTIVNCTTGVLLGGGPSSRGASVLFVYVLLSLVASLLADSCMHVCMCVHTYVRTYVCMYVCMPCTMCERLRLGRRNVIRDNVFIGNLLDVEFDNRGMTWQTEYCVENCTGTACFKVRLIVNDERFFPSSTAISTCS